MATLVPKNKQSVQLDFYTRFLTLIDSLSEQDKHRILKQSYYHSFHFFKIVLRDDPISGEKLRLHYWIKKGGTTQEAQNPHNHGWSFVSYIVRGSLHDTTWEEMDDHHIESATHSKYIMDLSTTDDVYYSHFDKFVNLAPMRSREFHAGECYTHDDRSVHTSEPVTDGTVTLVVQQRQTQDSNAIYVPRKQGVYHAVKHHRQPSMTELERVLKETRSSISQRLREIPLRSML